METSRRGEERRSALELHLGYWMRRISNHVSGEFARALTVKQTSVGEWVVLCRVRERPGVSAGELAEDLVLTRGAVSKIVDKLEARNWIARSTKPEDARVQLLSLTRAGSRVLPQLAEVATRNDRKFFDCLRAGEQATLRRLLVRLAARHAIEDVPIE